MTYYSRTGSLPHLTRVPTQSAIRWTNTASSTVVRCQVVFVLRFGRLHRVPVQNAFRLSMKAVVRVSVFLSVPAVVVMVIPAKICVTVEKRRIFASRNTTTLTSFQNSAFGKAVDPIDILTGKAVRLSQALLSRYSLESESHSN